MPAPRRSTIVALDTLALALVVLALAIFRTGGFEFTVTGVRVMMRSHHRASLAVLVVALARAWLAPRIGPFGFLTERWQRLLASTEREPVIVDIAPGRWRRAGVAALGLAVALGVLLHDQLAHMDRVPDLGDPLFSIWRVKWVLHQLVADPWHLFDANIFYPEHLTLTLSDPVILPSLMALPLLAIGVHPVVAYNVLFLSAFWLSGVATYLLVERLTGSARAAFLAGLAYGCYAYRFEHYSHLELQMTQWMPLALLALHLYLSTGRRAYAFAMAAAGVAQLYSAMYYAVFLMIYAAAIGIGIIAVQRIRVRSILRPLVAAGVVAAVLSWPIAHAFNAAEPMKGQRGQNEINFYSAFPSDYLRANIYSAVWYHHMRPPAPERTLFPGAAPLALAALSLVPPFGTTRLIYAAGLLVAVDGSLGVHGALYPLYHELIGPVRGLRSPARFAALVGLTLVILGGFGARRLLLWRPDRAYQHAMFALLVVAIMADAWPSLTLVPVWEQPPPIYDAVKFTPNPVLVEMPLPENETDNIPFMYFSTWHWAPLVNGYSGFIPNSYAEFHKAMLLFPDDDSINALRQRGVTWVTVNCALRQPNCDDLAAAMRRSTAFRLTTETKWMDGMVQLYELVPL